jgi:hypothetical protein
MPSFQQQVMQSTITFCKQNKKTLYFNFQTKHSSGGQMTLGKDFNALYLSAEYWLHLKTVFFAYFGIRV